MDTPTNPACPSRSDRFAWHEKLLARGGLGVAIAAGAVAIHNTAPLLAIGYLALAAVAGLLVVYVFLCPYCPYPFQYADCLFYPHQLLSWFTNLRGGKIPWAKNVGTAAAFAAILAVPQYWLWGQWTLLAVFWVALLPLAVLFPLHLCRRCRHARCPMNRGGGEEER